MLTPARLCRTLYRRALVRTMRTWRRLRCRHLDLPVHRLHLVDCSVTTLRCFHCKRPRVVVGAPSNAARWEAKGL